MKFFNQKNMLFKQASLRKIHCYSNQTHYITPLISSGDVVVLLRDKAEIISIPALTSRYNPSKLCEPSRITRDERHELISKIDFVYNLKKFVIAFCFLQILSYTQLNCHFAPLNLKIAAAYFTKQTELQNHEQVEPEEAWDREWDNQEWHDENFPEYPYGLPTALDDVFDQETIGVITYNVTVFGFISYLITIVL